MAKLIASVKYLNRTFELTYEATDKHEAAEFCYNSVVMSNSNSCPYM